VQESVRLLQCFRHSGNGKSIIIQNWIYVHVTFSTWIVLSVKNLRSRH